MVQWVVQSKPSYRQHNHCNGVSHAWISLLESRNVSQTRIFFFNINNWQKVLPRVIDAMSHFCGEFLRVSSTKLWGINAVCRTLGCSPPARTTAAVPANARTATTVPANDGLCGRLSTRERGLQLRISPLYGSAAVLPLRLAQQVYC